MHLNDQRQTWDMKPDGSYVQRKGHDPGLHQQLMHLARSRALGVESDSEGN